MISPTRDDQRSEGSIIIGIDLRVPGQREKGKLRKGRECHHHGECNELITIKPFTLHPS